MIDTFQMIAYCALSFSVGLLLGMWYENRRLRALADKYTKKPR